MRIYASLLLSIALISCTPRECPPFSPLPSPSWGFHTEPPLREASLSTATNVSMRSTGPLRESSAIERSLEPANLGMSYLGMCHPLWPCQESLRAFDGVPVLRFGWLAKTFGDECPCTKTLLQDSRPKQVRVHIANGPCLRNQRCGSYEPFAGETVSSASAKIARKDPRLLGKFRAIMQRTAAQLATAKAPMECFVSPCLECDLTDAARTVLFGMAQEIFPQCKLVDSVFRPRCIRGLICEKHGEKPALSAPCIADTDGTPASKIDIRAFAKRYQRCEAAHLWDFKFNLIDHHSSTFVDPRKRTTIPGRAYFGQFARYLRPGGLASPEERPVSPEDLKGCKGRPLTAADGPGGFTWKQSDTHPGVVAILPKGERPRTLKLIRDGRTLASFQYVADFRGDGRPIYRSISPQVEFLRVSNAVLKSELGCRVLKEPGFRID